MFNFWRWRYTTIYKFTEGFAAVCRRKKWGFVNEKGKLVIPLQFDRVGAFWNGSAQAMLEQTTIDPNDPEKKRTIVIEKWGRVNATGFFFVN